jgi:preprotein translocase subunit YajC
MKKVVLFTITFVLLISLVSAVEFEMKSEYKQGEALTAKLIGQFTSPPLKENIEFFRGHVRVAFDHEVAKIGDNFYIFASLIDKQPQNYSIVIDEVEYRQAGKTIDEPLRKNFTVIEEVADFTIDKGFISTNEDFEIILDNLQDESIDIEMNIVTESGQEGGIASYEDDESYTISVGPGTKDVEFQLASGVESSLKMITFSTENQNYTIPVNIFIDVETKEGDIFDFDIAPPELDITMPTNSNLTKLVYIYNTGTGRLNDIEINLDESLKPYVTISEDTFGQILPESNANFALEIVSGVEQSLGGDIQVTSAEGVSDSIRVSVKIEAGYEMPEEEQQQDLTTTDTCEEIGGQVCGDDEECSGDHVFAKNQFCCIGKCVKPVTSSCLKIIGWLILIIVITVGAWFFLKKYKKARKPVDLLRVAKGKKK